MSNVSYKIYQNDNLKKVGFHGKELSPLYIRIVYKRLPYNFKSYLFDLLARPKYRLKSSTTFRFPTLKHIKDLEAKTIEFIINKLGDNFTLPLFKTSYKHYTLDLLTYFETHYIESLKSFLLNQNMPHLSEAIYRGCSTLIPFEVTEDLKSAVPPELYGDLVKSSLLAVPYLPIYAFAKTRSSSLVIFPVMEWYSKNVQQDFRRYVNINFPEADTEQLIQSIENAINAL